MTAIEMGDGGQPPVSEPQCRPPRPVGERMSPLISARCARAKTKLGAFGFLSREIG